MSLVCALTHGGQGWYHSITACSKGSVMTREHRTGPTNRHWSRPFRVIGVCVCVCVYVCVCVCDVCVCDVCVCAFCMCVHVDCLCLCGSGQLCLCICVH